MKNILEEGNKSKNIPTRVKKVLLNQVYLLILVYFHAPRSGPVFLIWIWIQDNKINAGPCGSGYTALI
jgi:hypothetical protein